MKRNVWFVVVLLISLYCVLSFSNKVLSYKAPYGITQFEALSEQETDSVDVLFVGTSHVYSDINPAIIWEKSGIATFNLATGGAGLWNSYYAIQEALKTQSPKLIVLELFGVTFPNLEYRADREIMDANWGITNLITRWESLQVSAPKEKRIDFLLKFPYYHNRYKDIKKDDFEPYTHNYTYGSNQFFLYPQSSKKIYKGAVTLSKITPYEQLQDLSSITEVESIDKKSELYLEKIIKLARNEDIPLLFIVSPYMGCSADDQKKYNYIKELAIKNKIDYINFNLLVTELNLNPLTDFAEVSHLSYHGMKKYSEFLADYLLYHYDDLSNKTEGKGWESWDEYVKWENQVMYNFQLAEITEINEYLERLRNPYYSVIITFDRLSDEECRNIASLKNINLKNSSQLLLIYENGKTTFLNADAEEKKVFIQDIGSSNIVIDMEEGYSDVLINKKTYKKVNQGINIIIYDKYIDTIVDAVGFDSQKGFEAVR